MAWSPEVCNGEPLPRSVHLNSANLIKLQLHDMYFVRHDFLKEEEGKNVASETLGDFSKSLLFTWESRTQEQMETKVYDTSNFSFLILTGEQKYINHYL